MRNLLIASLFITLIINSFGQCANNSNIYTFTIYDTIYLSSQNSWYAQSTKFEIVKEKKGYAAAAKCAVMRGGFLAEIDSAKLNTKIFDEIMNGANVSSSYVAVNDGGGAAYVWLGGNDFQKEGTWKMDGDLNGAGIEFGNGQGKFGANNYNQLKFDNWGGRSAGANNEPDDFRNNQDALGMALGRWPGGVAGEWNDIDSSNQLYYVIQHFKTNKAIEDPTSVFEFKNTNISFQLYPNPANNDISLSLSGALNANTPLSYKLINVSGSVVYKGKWTKENNVIDVSALEIGQYIIQLETGNKILSKSFSIVK